MIIRTVEPPKMTPKQPGDVDTPSLLSLQFRAEHQKADSAVKIASVPSNCKGITVYAPDTSPIEVLVAGDDTVSNVIRKALAAHEAAAMDPVLFYQNPECYDLRLHEGT